MLRKTATLAVLEAFQVPGHATRRHLRKLAHRVTFDYEPRPGFLYVRSRAISSRANDNHDEFPADEIVRAYKTFLGKPVFVNHHNANHRRARGVIVAVALHRDRNPDGTPDTWAETLMEIDAVKFPRLCKAIIAGRVNRTSMGVDVEESTCTACGNKATDPAQYCRHLPALKGRKIRKRNPHTGKLEEEIIREVCRGLSFFENSLLVEDPADPTAYVLGKPDDRGMKMTAASQPLPPGVEGRFPAQGEGCTNCGIRFEDPRKSPTRMGNWRNNKLPHLCNDCAIGPVGSASETGKSPSVEVDKHGGTGTRENTQRFMTKVVPRGLVRGWTEDDSRMQSLNSRKAAAQAGEPDFTALLGNHCTDCGRLVRFSRHPTRGGWRHQSPLVSDHPASPSNPGATGDPGPSVFGGTHCAVCHEPARISLDHLHINGGWSHHDGMKRDHPAVPASPQAVYDSIPGQRASYDRARAQVQDQLARQGLPRRPTPGLPPDPFERQAAGTHDFDFDPEEPEDSSPEAEESRYRRELARMNLAEHDRRNAEQKRLFSRVTPEKTKPQFYFGDVPGHLRRRELEEHQNLGPGRIPLDPQATDVGRQMYEYRRNRVTKLPDATRPFEPPPPQHLSARTAGMADQPSEEKPEHPIKRMLDHLNDAHGLSMGGAVFGSQEMARKNGYEIPPPPDESEKGEGDKVNVDYYRRLGESMVAGHRAIHELHQHLHRGNVGNREGLMPHQHSMRDDLVSREFYAPAHEPFHAHEPESRVVKPLWYHERDDRPDLYTQRETGHNLHPERTDEYPNRQKWDEGDDPGQWCNLGACKKTYTRKQQDRSFDRSRGEPGAKREDEEWGQWSKRHNEWRGKAQRQGVFCPSCGAYKWMHTEFRPSEVGKATPEYRQMALEHWQQQTRGKTKPFFPPFGQSLSFLRIAAQQYERPEDHPFFQANHVSADHIVAAYHDSSNQERSLGHRWYADAHHVAKAIAGGNAARGAGLLAAYSPRTNWSDNMVHAHRAHQEGRAFGGPGEGAMTMHKNLAAPIIAGQHHSVAFRKSAPKIGDFAHLIEHGGDTDEDVSSGRERVVVDRHALSTAINRRVSKEELSNSPLSSRKYYEHVADAYRRAADRLSGELGIRISPHQVQATVWLRQIRKNHEEDAASTQFQGGGKGRVQRDANALARWHKHAHENNIEVPEGNQHVHYDLGVQHAHQPVAKAKAPARKRSTTRKGAVMRRQAYGETKAPPQIDTLRQEECPVCGESQVWTGQRCPVCGYVSPPDLFRDPDTSKAKQVREELDAENEAVIPGAEPGDVPPAGQGSWPAADEQLYHPDQIAPNGVPSSGPGAAGDMTQLEQPDEDEIPALTCPACGSQFTEEDGVAEGDPCPSCGQAPLEADEAPPVEEEDDGELADPDALDENGEEPDAELEDEEQEEAEEEAEEDGADERPQGPPPRARRR